MSKRKAYDQWQKEITEDNRRTPVYIQCECGTLALKAYRKEYFQCNNCQNMYDKNFNKIHEI